MAAGGQYGGVWAHDETRKSFGVAGRGWSRIKLSVPLKSFDGKHPRENAELAASLRDVVGKLAAEVAEASHLLPSPWPPQEPPTGPM